MTKSKDQTLTRTKLFWTASITIILVAFFFRFYRLADHPLGLFFDPAINGLDTLRLIQRGGHVIFFPTNGGREALFMYLLIPFVWLFDATPFSLRVLTATISLFNVVLLFGWLYRADFDAGRLSEKTPKITNPSGNHQGNFWLATLGGLTLATSYWHISISRLGQRPILVAMLAVPIFWLFFKGWITGQKRWFILSGTLMGLAGYTYSAARLLPIILVLTLLPEFWPGRLRRLKILNYRQLILNLTLFVCTALIIYLPMAWYLINYPAQFTARASSVMVWNFLKSPAEIVAEFGRNGWRVARFFCCEGSQNPIFGWPGYPGSAAVLLPFLLIGLLICFKQWSNLFYRLIPIWWFIGLIPSIIAIEAPHPLRMIVAVVPTAILIALGLFHTFYWLHNQLNPAASSLNNLTASKPQTKVFLSMLILYLFPLLLIALPVPGLFRAYFDDWTQLKSTQGIYDYDAVAIRDAVLAQADRNMPVYLPWSRYNDSTLLFYLSGRFQRQASLNITPADSVVIITPDKNRQDTTWIRLYEDMATVLPPLTIEGQRFLQAIFAGSDTSPITTSLGQIAARQIIVDGDPARYVEKSAYPLNAIFGSIQLTGATYPKALDPVEGFPVTLFWQAKARMKQEYEILLRVVDDNRQARGSGDGRPTDWVYPTSFWRPELDKIAAQHWLTLETTPLEPGRYWLAVSIFDPALRERVALTDSSSDSPDTFFIGPLKVPLPTPPVEAIQNRLLKPVNFGQITYLTAVDINDQTPSSGETIQLELLWQPQTTPEIDYTVFVHLIDADDQLVAGNDTQPLNGRYPTTIWSSDEQILDRHLLTIPPDLAPGQYRLAIGLYHHTTGQRLPLLMPDGQEDQQGRLVLEPPITIVPAQ